MPGWKGRRQKAEGRREKAEGRILKAKCTRHAIGFCLWPFAFCLSVIVQAEIIDRVLAVVGGVVITQTDTIAAVELGLITPGPTDDPMAAVLSQLIDRQLVLAEVDRYAPPEPTPDAIDRAAQAVRARFPSDQAYQAVLTRSGIDAARLRQTLRDRLRIDAYLEQRFAVASDRRTALVNEWVSGLRRRADITYLDVQRR